MLFTLDQFNSLLDTRPLQSLMVLAHLPFTSVLSKIIPQPHTRLAITQLIIIGIGTKPVVIEVGLDKLTQPEPLYTFQCAEETFVGLGVT